jgi:TolB protein
LYAIGSDGTGERRLTFANLPDDFEPFDFRAEDYEEFAKRFEHSQFPDLAPDGERILFQGMRLGEGPGLYVLTCGTGNIKQIVPGSASISRWSPDGDQIAFEQSGEFFSVGADGENRTKIDGAFGNFPAWSPDGAEMAFSGQGDIFKVDLMSGRVQQLTHFAEGDTWSEGATWSQAPHWSPDGQYIAFDKVENGNFDIFVMRADGSNLQRITHSDRVEARPVWSPDGRKIAFHGNANESGSYSDFEIYVMDADGDNVVRLTTNDSFDAHPHWGAQ